MTVTPTTTPTEPGPACSAFSAATWSTIACATVVSPARARCTGGASGLEVAASTKTPRSPSRARSSKGDNDPNPRYGEAVTASELSGESPSQACA
ncbi:Uncharacterised protein [Mycobacteroides abscessus subsp. abscessus]|nr:Uncharacterised protein [Mycobacteroides abscessus subsp. abscessus]